MLIDSLYVAKALCPREQMRQSSSLRSNTRNMPFIQLGGLQLTGCQISSNQTQSQDPFAKNLCLPLRHLVLHIQYEPVPAPAQPLIFALGPHQSGSL